MDYDFSFFLFVATVVTGLIWGGYLWYLKTQGQEFSEENEPLVVESARSFFPIVLIVFLLRSFLAEPFRIPSESMMPTLLIGDFLLVNKFTYGIRLPIINKKIIEVNQPQRGDIVVFRYPMDPTTDFIKRLIGLPGDKISYYHKKLFVNDKPIEQLPLGEYQGVGQGQNMTGSLLQQENLMGVEHNILVSNDINRGEGTFVVPAGQYFMMGDNRDNSHDSRFWGFVPEENLVGKAFFIWMSWDWDYHGIGFERIGTVLK